MTRIFALTHAPCTPANTDDSTEGKKLIKLSDALANQESVLIRCAGCSINLVDWIKLQAGNSLPFHYILQPA